MALILLTGQPASGKSRVADALLSHFSSLPSVAAEAAPPKDYFLLRDENLSTFSREIYRDASKEKEQRGWLRSEVHRHVTGDRSIVIVDSLNYVKGYRYELFCIAKEAKAAFCVVQCLAPEALCRQFNAARPPNEEKYADDVLSALFLRYEPPDSRNRWDSPLFSVLQPDGEIPLEGITEAVFGGGGGKRLRPNLSTASQPLAPSNFLFALDRVTQAIIAGIVSEQKYAAVGDCISVADTKEKLQLRKVWSLVELNRLRRQFIVYTKMHPVEDVGKIATMFVNYLNCQAV